MQLKNNKEKMETLYLGKTIILNKMNDPYAPPAGTKGTCTFVDDMGQVHMKWETGSTLALVHGLDDFDVIEEVNYGTV